MLPAASAAFAVIERAPSGKVTSILNLPDVSAIPLPTAVSPSYKVTVEPASAVPVIVRAVLLLVMLSVEEEPLSSVSARSSTVGAAGAIVSRLLPPPPLPPPPPPATAARSPTAPSPPAMPITGIPAIFPPAANRSPCSLVPLPGSVAAPALPGTCRSSASAPAGVTATMTSLPLRETEAFSTFFPVASSTIITVSSGSTGMRFSPGLSLIFLMTLPEVRTTFATKAIATFPRGLFRFAIDQAAVRVGQPRRPNKLLPGPDQGPVLCPSKNSLFVAQNAAAGIDPRKSCTDMCVSAQIASPLGLCVLSGCLARYVFAPLACNSKFRLQQ